MKNLFLTATTLAGILAAPFLLFGAHAATAHHFNDSADPVMLIGNNSLSRRNLVAKKRQKSCAKNKLASPTNPPTLPPTSSSALPSFAPSSYSERRHKPEVCYRPSGTALSVTAQGEQTGDEALASASASLEFGIVRVSDGESLLVDVMVQSMMLSRMGDDNDDDIDTDNYGEVVANAFLHKGCSALPCDDTTKSVFPGGLVMAYAGSYGSALQGGDDDGQNDGNGLEFKSTNTGKFLFPGLEEGSYLLQVEFDLTAAIDIKVGGEFAQDVQINEHLVTVTRTANEGECDWAS